MLEERSTKKTFALSIVLGIFLLGTLFLQTQIPTAKSANFVGQTIYLRADGSIEPSNAPVDVHGTTYTLTGDIQCPPRGYCILIERSGILLNGDGYTIEGWNPENEPTTSSFAIYAGFVNNIEIRNIAIKGCASGIELQSVSQANIHNTTITGQIQTEGSEPIGIFMMSCDSVSINQNNIVKNYIGLLVQSSNCTITNNRIMDNTGGGVTLATSGTTLISNLIARNDLGIDIQSSNNLIQDNDIINNKRVGIAVGASNNLFTGNNIAGQNSTSAYGIQMGPYQSGNTFRHNDFENNYIPVEGGDFAQTANVWDDGYPSGGNYWDTYLGVDGYMGSYQNETGSDGIGDTPYQITQANIDRYPLMAPVRPTPDIGEATINQADYTLPIIIALILAITIAALIIIYWRRKKKQKPKEIPVHLKQKTLVGKFSVPILLTLSIMIILNFTFITLGSYQLGSVELYGGALYFDEILIGCLSAILGVLVTWRIIIKQEHKSSAFVKLLSATLTSLLFVIYLLAYTAYHNFEIFGLMQYMQPTLVMSWTFVTTMIGCYLGFWLGEIALKRTPAPQADHKLAYSLGSGLTLIFTGFFSGYALGYVTWAIMGQVQTAIATSFPVAALYPPSLTYLAIWAVTVAILFPLGVFLKQKRILSSNNSTL